MSNPAPTSPKPTTNSAQNSPSGWTATQPSTKTRERGNYASPTASSSSTTTRAKSRTLDSASAKKTTSPTTATEKKVTLSRRNTEKSNSLSPTTPTASSSQSGWVSAKKGGKSTTPPPSTTPRRSSSSQDESALAARLATSSAVNDIKKTTTTTDALDLLNPSSAQSNSSRMKRSVSDADLAFQAAENLREQLRTGQPVAIEEEEEVSEEEHHEEHEEAEEEHPEEEQNNQTETQNETEQPSNTEDAVTSIQIQVPQIMVSKAKEPEPEVQKEEVLKQQEAVVETPHTEQPKIEPTPEPTPVPVEVKEAPVVQTTQEEPIVQAEPQPVHEPAPAVEEHNETPKQQEVVQEAPKVEHVEEPKHQEPSISHPIEQTSTEHPQEHQHPEPVVVKEAPEVVPTKEEPKEDIVVSQPVVQHEADQHQPLQQQAQPPQAEEIKPQEHQPQSEPPKTIEPAPVEVKEAPATEHVSVAPATQPEQSALARSSSSEISLQENDSLQFAMEPEPSKEVPPVVEQPKTMEEILEQQQLRKRQDEENRRKALVEQEDKIKRSVQDKIQKALEERRKQVLSPNSDHSPERRKSFDTNDLSTSAPTGAPSPMSKQPSSEPNLPIYVKQSPANNASICSTSAPAPPSILNSSPGGSKKDFKRVSFNFEDGRILYPGTDGHLDIVTHSPKREKEEEKKEKSPEKSAPPQEKPQEKSPEKSSSPPEKSSSPPEKSATPVLTVSAPASTSASEPTSPSTKEEAKQAALAEKRKSINDRIQMMLKPEANPSHSRRRSFDERDAQELITIRQQQDQRAKEEEEQQKQFHASRAKEFEEQKKKQIEEFKKQRDNLGTSNLYEREAQEEQDRLKRLMENKPVNQSDDPNLKGFDAELAKKMTANIDPSWEYNACKWIEQLSGESVYDSGECLYTGIVLCKLINAIKPNMIAKFYSKPIALMQTENIKLYLQACLQLGVAKDDLFSVSDLHSKKNMKAVISNIYALARVVQNQPDWKGPTLLNAGPAPPAAVSPRPASKTVAIPIVPTRDRSKTEDLPGGLKSSAPEFRDRSRTAGAKLSSNVSDLQHEVITLREELESLRKQLADKDKVIKVLKPPKWRPDEDVERCTLCATEFSFFNRRHHCRQCGEIFCGNCCSKSFDLGQLNKNLPRVCNRCFIDLESFQSSMGSVIDSWNVY